MSKRSCDHIVHVLVHQYSPRPQATPKFYLTAVEKNWEEAWNQNYVTDRKWWTQLVQINLFVPLCYQTSIINNIASYHLYQSCQYCPPRSALGLQYYIIPWKPDAQTGPDQVSHFNPMESCYYSDSVKTSIDQFYLLHCFAGNCQI